MFTLRFDMRAPTSGASTTELYAAALEMCAWSEDRGAVAAVLSEHHGADDGHLPVPLILASAIAARTSRLAIVLAAVTLPLYDPVRLAEEIAVLDVISNGRVVYVFGLGHRAEEYAHFGVAWHDRGRIADEHLGLLIGLLRGETVERDTGTVRVRPLPLAADGPSMMIGGASTAAVRRAAKFGLGVIAQASPPGLKERYEQECRAAGREPGTAQFPDPSAPTAVFVSDDIEAAWDELGPYLLYDAKAAAAWREGDTRTASITHASTVEELRAATAYRVMTTAEAREWVGSGRVLNLLPLCGGLPTEVAWRYLEHAASATEGSP